MGATVWRRGIRSGHLDGIGVYTRELSRIWNIGGSSPLLLEFTEGKPGCEMIDEENIELCKIGEGYPRHLLRSLGAPWLPASNLKDFEKRIDLFFAPDHYIPVLKSTPVVATVMDLIPLLHPEWVSARLRPIKNRLFPEMIRRADHLITISQYSKRDIVTYLGIPSDRIDVVTLGVHSRFYERLSSKHRDEILARYGLKENFFIFVGTIQPRKNLRRLIAAYTRLPLSLRKKHALVIVGKYGWGESGLRKQLEQLAPDDSIRWLNTVEDKELVALLQSARALVYPSLYEGFGLPLLEGFAARTAVMASRTTSLPEVGGDAVYYVDPEDIDSIRRGLWTLAQEDALVEELRKKGEERVQNYSWERSAGEHEKIFSKVLSGRELS